MVNFYSGVFFILMLYHFLVWTNRKEDKTNLAYAYFNLSLIFLFYTLNYLKFNNVIYTELFIQITVLLMLSSFAYMGIIILKQRRFINFVKVYFLVLVILTIIMNIHNLVFNKLSSLNNISYILYCSFWMICMTLSAVDLLSDKERRKNKYNIIYLVNIGLITLNIIIASLIFFNSSIKLKDNLLSTHFIFSSFVLFLLVTAYALTGKFNQEHKKLKDLTADLEQKVIDRTQELSEAKKQIEDENIKRKDFYVNLSNDIKTPLTLISNYLNSYLKKNTGNKELEIVEQNVGILSCYITNLTDAEMLHNKKYKYDIEEIFNFSEIIKQKVIIFKETAGKKNIDITDFIDNDLYIKIDPFSLDKVVNNLIWNAVKYTNEHGKITVMLKSTDNKIFLVVSDNGTGIPPDRIKNIFDPYYQIEHDKFNYQGTGMGLYITKEILNNAGAEIKVTSEINQGTSFQVIFKKFEPDENDIINEYLQYNKSLDKTSLLEVKEKEFNKFKDTVLVVEDNIEILELLQKILEEKYNVFLASNGKAALDKLENEAIKPDLILSDIMMDEMDGIIFREKILKTNVYQNIPFIFLTARNFLSEKERSYKELKIDDYITKPFSSVEVITKVNAMINR
jgi:signal transduction histidine kinase